MHASAEKHTYYGIAWDDYLKLLDELADAARLRVTFDGGVLEIMSPKSEPEECFASRSKILIAASNVLKS